jgi:uncharacterized small protein (DUF1192 family)
MDIDELFPLAPGEPLGQLTRQDLDPFSVDELRKRITILQAEIDRTTRKIDGAVSHRAGADALFKR